MSNIINFPGRPDLAELAKEYTRMVVIGVSDEQIQIISNMEDPDILYSMEVAKAELINSYFVDGVEE